MAVWQKPKTTRRYIHPPMSERFYTIWSEGKLILGEAEAALGPKYFDIASSGIWFFDKEKERAFDVKEAVIIQREDGIPVHGVKHKLGELDFSLECFAPLGLAPACYIKIRVENNTDSTGSAKLGILLRTALEHQLVDDAPDCYAPHNPSISTWEKLSCSWTASSGFYTDGERKIYSKGNINFCFDETAGVGVADIVLAPGGACEEFFVFNIGKISHFDYGAERDCAICGWRGELARIKKDRLPRAVRESAERMKTITNLTVQLLQCFCRPKGTDFVFARQGGLRRQVWTFESMSVLEALGRIGDFSDYIEPVIDLYFNEFFTESGEMLVFGIPWAMATANVLQSFSIYAMQKKDKEYFSRYFEKAYRSFLWIKDTRASVVQTDTVAGGLFPPLQSCDSPLVFQSWTNTDTFNLRGLRAFSEACEIFGKDSAAKEVRAEYEGYMNSVRSVWEKIKHEENGGIKIPYSPIFSDGEIVKIFPFSPFIAFFVDMLDFDLEDTKKVVKAYTDTGMIRGGLYDRMPDKAKQSIYTKYNLDLSGRCVVWYVACQEYYWFSYFLRHGMREQCEEIMRDIYRYAMTEEYYMLERYHENEPYFVPWSPNASANGRVINMILDFYK